MTSRRGIFIAVICGAVACVFSLPSLAIQHCVGDRGRAGLRLGRSGWQLVEWQLQYSRIGGPPRREVFRAWRAGIPGG